MFFGKPLPKVTRKKQFQSCVYFSAVILTEFLLILESNTTGILVHQSMRCFGLRYTELVSNLGHWRVVSK